MTDDEYLEAIVLEHSLAPGSAELSELQQRGEEVKAFLRKRFGSEVRVNEAGSKRKGTMIKDSYDLDLTCYFPSDDCSAGDSLADIYEAVESALAEDYLVSRKRSALRLSGLSGETALHIDVVPGRFVNGNEGDVFLHRSFGDKERLKTNLGLHVAHVRDSGVRDAIKLTKLWRELNHVDVKTFVLELLVIKLLSDKRDKDLSEQMRHLWQELKERAGILSVEDPANPTGNDLSQLLNDQVRTGLATVASNTLQTIEDAGLEAVFGTVNRVKAERVERLRRVASAAPAIVKPWAND